MAKVYHEATEVVLWSAKMAKIPEQLWSSSKSARTGRKGGWRNEEPPRPYDLWDASLCGSFDPPFFPWAPWETLVLFLERPVIRRLWIVQGMAMAARARVRCGGCTELELHVLAKGAAFLSRKG